MMGKLKYFFTGNLTNQFTAACIGHPDDRGILRIIVAKPQTTFSGDHLLIQKANGLLNILLGLDGVEINFGWLWR